MPVSGIDWSLYAILDKAYQHGRSLSNLAEAAIAGGAGVIQVRNKDDNSRVFYEDALVVREVTARHGIPLIINDRVDIALLVEADGVHLGQDDLPFAKARDLIGDTRILGASVHDLTELANAMMGDPDYLGVGTIYPSATKSELKSRGIEVLQSVRQVTDLPIVAIGGITANNLEAIFRAGANGVAVISDLFVADDVKHRAHTFVQQIEQARSN